MNSDANGFTFLLSGATWSLRFSDEALRAMRSGAQRRWFHRETVGQLFTSDLTTEEVVVDAATKLRPVWAARSGVRFNGQEALAQREELLASGLHCVGLWHTHPEPECLPSPTDTLLAADHAGAARANLNGLVFVIVSNQPAPRGWFVAIHDGRRFHRAVLRQREPAYERRAMSVSTDTP